MSLGQPAANKELNKIKILKLIKDNKGVSRAELSNLTGLDRSTITHLVRELLNDNLVVEAGEQRNGGAGRRAVKLHLNSKARYAIGVKIGDSKIQILLIDMEGHIHRNLILPVPQLPQIESLMDKIVSAVSKILQAAPENGELLGIGVGVAGVVNPVTGHPEMMPNFKGDYRIIKHQLEKAFMVPVCLDNEVNTMALGELWYGQGKGYNSLLFINIGRGIGSALVYNDQIYRGFSGIAGEIGHTVIDINGPRCGCGNRGCLETVAGGQALIAAYRQGCQEGNFPLENASEEEEEFQLINRILASGNPVLNQTANQISHYLGIGIANAIHNFNPEICLLGGSLVESCSTIVDKAVNLSRQCMLDSAKGTVIRKAALENNAEALGAAVLVLEQFFAGAPTSQKGVI